MSVAKSDYDGGISGTTLSVAGHGRETAAVARAVRS